LQSLSITRGKSRELDRFNAGQLTANFINNQRYFDPTYASSPFFGQIVPKRSVRVTYFDEVQFVGIIDDWNISYDASGFSVSTCVAFDAFTQLSNLAFSGFEPDVELSGARVNSALDNVSWSSGLRDINSGNEILEEQIVTDGFGLIDYLTTVEQSELGFLFVDKLGKVKFVDRSSGYSVSPVTFSDAGDGIPYVNIGVTYGSELLYNDISLTSTAGTANVQDAESQGLYGKRQLERATFIDDYGALENVAQALLTQYSEPDYRFSVINIDLTAISTTDKEALAALELGDIVGVKFTPSDIPPQVTRTGRIIGLAQTHQPELSTMTIALESLQGVPLIIGSSLFGIIGVGTIGF